MKSIAFLAVLPVLALAAKHEGPSRVHSHMASRGVYARAPEFKLVKKYQGKTFLDNFDFFTGEDPTHGTVDFVTREEALSSGLAIPADNITILGVDAKTKLQVGQKRKSIRISSKDTFSSGLFIADIFAAPHGCGTWPAYWTLGTSAPWPQAGEVDVFETTHNTAHNAVTLHTTPGCDFDTQPKPLKTSAKVDPAHPFTGQIAGKTCASGDGHNEGCGVVSTDTRSAGEQFNRQGGGILAHRMDSQGIAVWQFPRDAIPADIVAGKPNPDTWPTPVALFSSDKCNVAEHFSEHTIIFDITLCGDLGNPTFGSSGCPATCAEAVANPDNFKFAQFKVASVSVFQQQ